MKQGLIKEDTVYFLPWSNASWGFCTLVSLRSFKATSSAENSIDDIVIFMVINILDLPQMSHEITVMMKNKRNHHKNRKQGS